jgi:hypothetical protein
VVGAAFNLDDLPIDDLFFRSCISINQPMALYSPAMLKPSEIISAQALVTALNQEFDLPTELRAELYIIGDTLRSDPSSIDTAIQDCLKLIATDPTIQAAYQTARNNLQAASNNSRKGVPPKPIDPNLEFSQEIANAVRDVCLSAGKEPQQPVSLWDRLLGKKSKVS